MHIALPRADVRLIRAVSLVGRAPHLQCGGREFESPTVHQDLARSLGLVWGNTFTEPGDVARATTLFDKSVSIVLVNRPVLDPILNRFYEGEV